MDLRSSIRTSGVISLHSQLEHASFGEFQAAVTKLEVSSGLPQFAAALEQPECARRSAALQALTSNHVLAGCAS